MAKGAIRIDWFPVDALNGMTFLTPVEELAYRRIIDLIYINGGELPDDDAILAEQTRSFGDWPAVKAGLLRKGKIEVADGVVTNGRCTEILTTVAERVEKARVSGLASGRKRRQVLPGRTRGEPESNDRSPQVATQGATPDELSQGVRESVQETDVSLTARESFAIFARAYPKQDAVMAARTVWARLMKAGTPPADVMAGLERWKGHWRARINDPKDDFQPRHIRNAARWLEQGGWLDPDPVPEKAASALAATRVWRGPPHVRALVVSHAGEDFARSYLDPADWDGGSVVAATATAAEKLRRLPALSAHPIRNRKETQA